MRKVPFFLFLTAVAMLSLSGCDLFGDDQYCQYESHDSRIWNAGTDVNYAPGDTCVSFVFNRGSVVAERCFQIKNVCPLAAVAIRVTVTEKGSIFEPQANAYKALLVEVLPESGWYRVRKVFPLYRESGTILKGHYEHVLVDLPESGPREFFIGVSATFPEGVFTNKLDLEDWAQAHVSEVVFEADYVKWE